MKYLIIIVLLSLTACDSIPGWVVNKCVNKCGVGKVDYINEMLGGVWLCTCTNGWQCEVTTDRE